MGAPSEIRRGLQHQLSEPQFHVIGEHGSPHVWRLSLASKSRSVQTTASQVDTQVSFSLYARHEITTGPDLLQRVRIVPHHVSLAATLSTPNRSEERRVGKECRS